MFDTPDATYALGRSNTCIVDNLFRPESVMNENGQTVGVDLNLDGTVDIQDLSTLALVYGKNLGSANGPSWGYLDNLAGSGIVDIYDFVLLAGKYGKPYTPSIAN